jgi:hypothetical protein
VSAVLAPVVAAVLMWRCCRWGWLRLGLTFAAVVVGSIAIR